MFRIRDKIRSILIGISIFIPLGSLYYIFENRENPLLVEIVVGSIILSFCVGLLPSLASTFFQQGNKSGPKAKALYGILSLIFLVVAFLLYSSNVPKNISREIQVTYLVNLDTKELPQTLRFSDTTTSKCYADTASLFKHFKEKNPENLRIVWKLLNANIAPGSESLRVFQDLTEYLTIYFIGDVFTTDEVETTIYHTTTSRWLGFPDKSIAEMPKSIDYISGPLKDNLFYGLYGINPETKLAMHLPRETTITLEKNDNMTSVFVINNDFMEIRIGIHTLLGSSGNYAVMDPKAFLPSSLFSPSPFAELIKKESKGPFKQYNTIVYYDVVFKKLWYGSYDRKYHEEWANNLFSVLKRKFAWGSPALMDPL